MVRYAALTHPTIGLGSAKVGMIEVKETLVFAKWLEELRDAQARILRLRQGNFGDVKVVREGVSELRIDYGPGYRVYFLRRGEQLVILLAGGDKRTQPADIKTALELARHLREKHD
jgi:putative addiction module killer protein